MDLRFVRFPDLRSFLSATDQYDESFMGHSIGTLFQDYISKQVPKEVAPNSQSLDSTLTLHLFAIYRGEELLCVRVKPPPVPPPLS